VTTIGHTTHEVKRVRKKDLQMYLIIFAGVIIYTVFYHAINWSMNLSILEWIVLIIIISALVLVRKKYKKEQLLREAEERRLELERQGNLKKLQKMNGIEFEHYIGDLFIELGYQAHETKSSGDGGKDIMIYKDNYFAVVECKCYKRGNKISRPQIQQFHSALIDSAAEEGYFITTSDFTKHAKNYVLDKPIILINGQKLVKLIQEVTEDDIDSKSTHYLSSLKPN